MFRTVPPPQGDPCRRHDGTSLPHTAMSVGFLQPQKKRTVPPSILYISRLFKIYSRSGDRRPATVHLTAARSPAGGRRPQDPLSTTSPHDDAGGGGQLVVSSPTPPPSPKAARKRGDLFVSPRGVTLDSWIQGRSGTSSRPRVGTHPTAYFVGTWRGPDLFDLFDHRRGYPPWWWTDGPIDRSCAVDGALARVTNESRRATFSPRRSPSRADLVAPRACRSHHACDPSPPPRERQHRRQGPLRPRFGRCSRSGATWPSGRTYGVFIRVFI